ncbi:conserved hypothetical protein (plasmid) [Rhodococcus jostii RHA1]|uniref:Hsp70 protein n=1 Tax=Rhodococcus jostii (strain RHA1) TaxID=101510 RepID=Q0S075_RHOJR|nr:hypothetical protein [Rhodococcus jostii]ABG99061.1 conserved hypothetical protein [Rhodococcus jostii RHA1]
MTRGLGLSIGTAGAVAAVAGEDGVDAVLTRRSTLTFGPPSTVRLGNPPDGAGVTAGFTDRIGEAVAAGDGFRYTGQDLVAAAAHCLIAETATPDDTPIVLTHPAVHPARDVHAQRTALDRAGLARVGLVAEPVAAVAWLESEHGPLGDGLALVYDLGADSLDLTVVAFGVGSGSDPIVGRPLRSTEFGGRYLIGVPEESVQAALSGTLELVVDCLHFAHVSAADLDVVVLTGGAGTLSAVGELVSGALGTAIVCAPDPATTAARGAAVLAAASHCAPIGTATRSTTPGPRKRWAAVAAVAAAALLAVPLFARESAPNPAPSDIAASQPLSRGGFGVVEQAERPHIPSRRAAGWTPPTAAEAPPEPVAVDYIAYVPVVEPVLVRAPAAAAPVVVDAPTESVSASVTSTSLAAPLGRTLVSTPSPSPTSANPATSPTVDATATPTFLSETGEPTPLPEPTPSDETPDTDTPAPPDPVPTEPTGPAPASGEPAEPHSPDGARR